MNKYLFLLVLTLPTLIFSQKIIKIQNNFALVNTDQGIGELNQTIDVYRNAFNGKTIVGKIQITKFKNSMTACKIIAGQLRVSDYVKSENPNVLIDNLFETDDRASTPRQYHNRKSEVGFEGSILIPMGLMNTEFTTSFNIGGFVSLPIYDAYSIVVEILYCILNWDSQIDKMIASSGLNVDGSILMLLGYDRIALNPTFFIDIGGGIYIPRISVSGFGQSDSQSENGFGICLGPTFKSSNRPSSIQAYLAAKFHSYNIEGEWIKFITVGLQLSFQTN